MIIAYGEILVDTFRYHNRTDAFVGGAPFNVCYAIRKMGKDALFVGSIGDDAYGHLIEDFFAENHLENKGLRVDAKRPTAYSEVTLKNNDRSFTFHRDDAADDVFAEESIDFIPQADIVHLGSLMLSSERGRDFFHKVITAAHSQHKPVSFDINFREDIFPDLPTALHIYNDILPEIDILKFSKEEIALFCHAKNIPEALETYRGTDKLVLVTDSRNGSYAYVGDHLFHADTIKVNAIDPTGAGDAFYGAFLSQVDSFGLSAISHIPSLLTSSLRFGNVAGALSTTKKGALSAIPSYQDVVVAIEGEPYQSR